MIEVALIVEEDFSQQGGHALVRLDDSDALPSSLPATTAVQLRRADDRAPQLSANGWGSDPALFSARLIGAEAGGGTYGLGPEVVEQIANGTPVILRFPDLGIEGRAIWPDIPPFMDDVPNGTALTAVQPSLGFGSTVTATPSVPLEAGAMSEAGSDEQPESADVPNGINAEEAEARRLGKVYEKQSDSGTDVARVGGESAAGALSRGQHGAGEKTEARSPANELPKKHRGGGGVPVALAAALGIIATAASAASVILWMDRAEMSAARATAEADLATAKAQLEQAATAPVSSVPKMEAGRVATALHDFLMTPLRATSPRGEALVDGMAAEALFEKANIALAADEPEAIAEGLYWLRAASQLGHHDALIRSGELKLDPASGAPEILEGVSLIALGATLAGRPIDLPESSGRGPVPASTKIAVGLLGANNGDESQRLFNWISDKRYDRSIPEWSDQE